MIATGTDIYVNLDPLNLPGFRTVIHAVYIIEAWFIILWALKWKYETFKEWYAINQIVAVKNASFLSGSSVVVEQKTATKVWRAIKNFFRKNRGAVNLIAIASIASFVEVVWTTYRQFAILHPFTSATASNPIWYVAPGGDGLSHSVWTSAWNIVTFCVPMHVILTVFFEGWFFRAQMISFVMTEDVVEGALSAGTDPRSWIGRLGGK